MLLSVIIVSYNTEKLTLETIESVLSDVKASSLLKRKTEIIVIDNHSDDSSLKALRKICKDGKISLIASQENLGFAGGNNLGIERARGEFILLLNSDTLVQPGTLEKMVTAFTEAQMDSTSPTLESARGKLDRLGILAATLFNPDGSLQPQGGSFPNLLSLSSHMLMLDDIPVIGKLLPSTQHTGLRATNQPHVSTLLQQDWVGGTAMMIRKTVFDEIGLLDPNIFMYGEDIEFCLRAKSHHWDIALHPAAGVVHLGSASSTSANALIGEAKGYVYIWSKHKPLWQVGLVKLLIRLGALLRILIFGTIRPNAHKRAAYRRLLRTL